MTNPAQHDDDRFPLDIACVDMGSNAIRFMAARFYDVGGMRNGSWDILARERVPVRLGHEVFRTGSLDAKQMDAAVEALRVFRATVESLGIEHVRCVATSAVREAHNGLAFMKRVREETGWEIATITGTEEIRLVHRATHEIMGAAKGRTILADLGGGSLEVALIDDEGVLLGESHTIGTVRLLEDLEEASHHSPKQLRRLIDEYLRGLRIPELSADGGTHRFVATGGNMDRLATLVGRATKDRAVRVVQVDKLAALVDDMAALTPDQRMTKYDLRADRADVILPAALVYTRLANLLGARRIHVPDVGVKEGLLLDQMDRIVRAPDREVERARQVHTSAVALGRRFRFDESHAEKVAQLSLSLFDQTKALHGYADNERDVLLAAALLHDVGQYLAYKGHHKHSHYIISQSEIAGLDRPETLLAALVARYHRKADPALKHGPYEALEAADRSKVVRLASILRIADSLDREHAQNVDEVNVRYLNDGKDDAAAPQTARTAEVSVDGDGDFLLERWALDRKAGLFESTFGLRLTFKDDTHANAAKVSASPKARLQH